MSDGLGLGGRGRVLLSFAAFGMFWGAWGAVLPAVQRASGVGDGALGLALLLVGFGALLSMRIAGRIDDRFRGRGLPVAVLAFAVAGLLPGLARSGLTLGAALLVLGATSGALDVVINAAGVREEMRSDRRLLHLAHACFSAAVVGASLATGGLRALGAEPVAILGGVAVVVACAGLLVRIPGGVEPIPHRHEADAASRVVRRRSWLIVLGGLTGLAFVVENAWQSWGAVHLERTLGAGPGESGLGPALFAAAAVGGRLAGQRLTTWLGDRRLVLLGATVAAAGTVIGALAPVTWVALIGIVVAGAGCAVCAPALIGLAGRGVGEAERGAAVATVTTIAYLGFLIGPAVVGLTAGASSLRVALVGVAGVAVVLAGLVAVVDMGPGVAEGRVTPG